MMRPTLAELLAQIQSGEESALLALHEQYAGLVYSVAYRVLNDQMSAEEVTQDTFMRLWNKAEILRLGQRLVRYLAADHHAPHRYRRAA